MPIRLSEIPTGIRLSEIPDERTVFPDITPEFTQYDMDIPADPKDFAGPVFREAEPVISNRKPFGKAVEHGIDRLGMGLVQTLSGAMRAEAEFGGELRNRFWSWMGKEKPQYQKKVDKWLLGQSKELSTGLKSWYESHPETAVQLDEDAGFSRTLQQYVTQPEILIQSTIESAGMILEGVGGTLVAGPAGGIIAMGLPLTAQTYEEARQEKTKPVPALARSIFTGMGEAAIEQWTLGKQFGIAEHLLGWIRKSGVKKVLWEGAKTFFRGMAEEGSQEFNRNFWRWVFTDRKQDLLENVATSAAAGGPMELALGGIFGATGAGASAIGPMVDNERKIARVESIRTSALQSPELSDKSIQEINTELDKVAEDIQSGVYETQPAVEPWRAELAELEAKPPRLWDNVDMRRWRELKERAGETREVHALRLSDIKEAPTFKEKTPEEFIETKPIVPEKADKKTLARAHVIAKKKGLISHKGKPTQSYHRFARAMTGQTSMAKMDKEQAAHFAEMLDALPVDSRGVAHIPTSKAIITKDLADKIGEFKNIGFLERFREAGRVFEKIGLYEEVFAPAVEKETVLMEELFEFRKELKGKRKTIGKGKEVSAKLFNAMENPGTVELTPAEEKTVAWAKKFFDDWANRLNLPAEKRRQNYITHIFEKAIEQDLKAKHPIDPDLVKAFDYITPKTIFNPYLQERIGKKVGLRQDFWAALEAYEYKALKKFHYEPLIQRIRVYKKFLPPSSAKYLQNFVTRITGRPLVIDREINQTLKEFATKLEKMPGGKELGRYLTSGNASGMLAYNMAGIYYEAWLGLRPASAIKNLSQNGLTLAETGPVAFYKALATPIKERTRLLKNSLMLRTRKLGFLPGVDESFIRQLESKRRKISMAMFKAADRVNISNAFLAGYYEAKSKNLPDSWAYKRGDEVARKTQYLYTKLAGSQFSQTAPGRVLGVLTTWPRNWAELMNDWVQGKPSSTYTAYAKATGQKVAATNWLSRRKSLWIYLSMTSLAMLIHKRTPFKALYYTGWTSIKALTDVASGRLPGLEIPRMVGNLIVGALLLDKRRLKEAWNEAKRFVVILKELRDILSGKKDWLNLFVYYEKKKKAEEKKGRPVFKAVKPVKKPVFKKAI